MKVKHNKDSLEREGVEGFRPDQKAKFNHRTGLPDFKVLRGIARKSIENRKINENED